MSRITTAHQYARLGLHVLPLWWIRDNGQCACGKADCTSPGKHPISKVVPHGHKNATTDEKTLSVWFAMFPKANLGIALKPSGLALVDIDPRNGGDATWDAIEAKHGKITSSWMQRTGGDGTHLLFIAPVGLLPSTLGPGIDLKIDGYFAAEPSITAGPYTWLDGGPLDSEDWPSPWPNVLAEPAAERAAPMAPTLHTTAPGFLWMGEQGRAELESAMRACPNVEYDEWLRMGMVLHMLDPNPQGAGFQLWDWWAQLGEGIHKYDPRIQVEKWQSFTRGKPCSLHRESIFWWAKKYGWRPADRIVYADELPDDIHLPPQVPTYAIDPDLLEIPVPALQYVVDYLESFSEEPQRQISVQGALALASTLAGRLYVSTNNNPPSCYFLTLAGTGVGKNYVKTGMVQLLCDAGQEKLISGSGNTSAGAVFSALIYSPCHIQVMDEFGKHLAMARAQANGSMMDAFAVLTEAYSDAAGILRPRNYSKFTAKKEEIAEAQQRFVRKPAITLFAFSAPEQVFERLTSHEIDDGFLNRLIIVSTTLPPESERPLRRTDTPDVLKDWVAAVRKSDITQYLHNGESEFDKEPLQTLVGISPEADEIFTAFKAEIKAYEAAGQYTEPKLVRRWRENAMRLGTALAVAENPDNPVISGTLADWAVRYIRQYGTQFMVDATFKVADSDHHRLYKEILRVVQDSGLAGRSERELAQYSRLFQRTPPQYRDAALSALQRDGEIECVRIPPRSGRGKERLAYRVLINVDSVDKSQTETSTPKSRAMPGFE